MKIMPINVSSIVNISSEKVIHFDEQLAIIDRG
jgi:hypothetical protein